MTRLLPFLILLLAVVATSPASRAEAPRAPEGAEILLQGRLLPPPAETRRMVERLRGYELFDRGLELLKSELGVDLQEDVLSWVEGTVVAAVVRTGDESPISGHMRRQELVRQYFGASNRLWVVQSALNTYAETEGKPPEKLADLVPDYLAEAGDVEGFRYERKGRTWTLACVFPEGSELAAFPTPSMDEEGNLVEVPAPTAGPVNFSVSLRVTDPALADRKLRGLLARSGMPVAAEGPLVLPASEPVRLEVRGSWLTATDNPEVLPRVYAGLSGRAPLDPGLARMLASVPANPDFLVYVDVPGILAHWKGLPPGEAAWLEALRAVKGFIVATHVRKERVLTESFLALEPSPGHPLARLLQGPEETRMGLARRVPWSVSYVDFARVDLLWRSARDLAGLHPLLEGGLDMVRQGVESSLGVSLEQELLPASTGELVLNMEAVDLVSSAVIQGLDLGKKRSTPDEGASEEASPEGEAAPGSPEPPAEENGGLAPLDEGPAGPGLQAVPFTLLVSLRPGPARQAVLARLEERLGADPTSLPFEGGEIRQARDRSLAYTVRGDFLVVSVGPTLRLMKQMVLGVNGRVPALTDLDSYQEFRKDLRGRLLLLRHAKTDAMYSVLKGALLFLGAEFRAEADQVGLWRDAYAAVTLEPGGIRARGALYPSTQVP